MVEIKQFDDSQLEQVKEVVKSAFYREGKDSQFNEWNFIDDVRRDRAYIEELCFVAVDDSEYLGYVLLTEAHINANVGLVLGPLAVKDTHQKKGIGKQLVRYAIERAKALGYCWIALTGGDYYYQFGFEDASTYDVRINEGHPENKYLKLLILDESKTVHEGCIVFADSFYDANGELL